jgi:hypothetical protein
MPQLSRLCLGEVGVVITAEQMASWQQQLQQLPRLRVLELEPGDLDAHAPQRGGCFPALQ